MADDALPPELGRYAVQDLLGSGGMGLVYRVQDPRLGRDVAAKVLRLEHADSPERARFVAEAQITAQLRHPSIVSVHELGELADGRAYFTMEEIEGRTMEQTLEQLHQASDAGHWGRSEDGWTFSRLIEAFRRTCEAVAYAHSRRVVHRDLKPSNVMLGRFGEVLVMDWGLAKVLDEQAPEPLRTGRNDESAPSTDTRAGALMGTPAFMSPEQARGDWARVGTASDVYALGAILYNILRGQPPYLGDTGSVIAALLQGELEPPDAPSEHSRGPVPADLAEICLRAMAPDPQARHADAAELAADVAAWLDGSRRRDTARTLVQEAAQHNEEAAELHQQAERLRTEAFRRLEHVAEHDPVELKLAGWALEDRARRLELQANLVALEGTRTLQTALSLAPDLPEAHAGLANYYRTRHARAEAERDPDEAALWEVLLRDHDRGEHRDYLEGTGALTLVTDPPNAQAVLYRFVEQDRRLVPERVRSLGRTPIHKLPLQAGDYLVSLRRPGYAELRYPVSIGRLEHWDGVPPGATRPAPITLLREGVLDDDERYIPGGWFQAGGDPGAPHALSGQRIWVDDRVFKRFPVRNREYLAFLNDLVDQGQPELAKRYGPRFEGFLLLNRSLDGHYTLRTDMTLFSQHPDAPVVMIDWHGAKAYADWEAERTGLPWDLPEEIAWEKAARGVDGRIYPWGNYLDPTWCNVRDSQVGAPGLAQVSEHPVDESVYGLRGMGGNTMDWCRDSFRASGPPIADGRYTLLDNQTGPRAIRGGHWYSVDQLSRCAHRFRLEPQMRAYMIGFRLARTLN